MKTLAPAGIFQGEAMCTKRWLVGRRRVVGIRGRSYSDAREAFESFSKFNEKFTIFDNFKGNICYFSMSFKVLSNFSAKIWTEI